MTRNSNEDIVIYAEHGDALRVRELLDSGVDVNTRLRDGRTPLHAALAEGNIEIALLLIERGANKAAVDARGLGALHWAVGSHSVAALLAAYSPETGIDPRDAKGLTPLSWAVQGNDDVAIEWLLDHGADADSSDNDGWCPIHHAAACGRLTAVKQLLSAGAQVLKRLPSGHSALDLAKHFAKDPDVCIVLEAAEISLALPKR